MSNETNNNQNVENNIENENINSQGKGDENQNLESSNKFANFIK